MKRREFVGRLGLGSAAILAGGAMAGAGRKAAAKAQHDHTQVEGPLAAATVSFGQWKMPLDRHPVGGTPPATNQHLLIPYVAMIRAGGSVNFIISGLHQIGIYEPGTELTDIDPDLIAQPPTMPPTINDPDRRLYRGISPIGIAQDRIEVVTFAEPGLYLVVCLVRPHFVNDKMHGYVKVVE